MGVVIGKTEQRRLVQPSIHPAGVATGARGAATFFIYLTLTFGVALVVIGAGFYTWLSHSHRSVAETSPAQPLLTASGPYANTPPAAIAGVAASTLATSPAEMTSAQSEPRTQSALRENTPAQVAHGNLTLLSGGKDVHGTTPGSGLSSTLPDPSEAESRSGLEITGSVVHDSGLPAGGARVSAARLGSPNNDRRIVTTTADAKGRFVIAGLYADDYRLAVTETEAGFPETKTVRAGTRDVTLTVAEKRIARVTGRVEDLSGLPVDNVSVRFTTGRTSATSTDESGRFESVVPYREGKQLVAVFTHNGFMPQTVRLAAEKFATQSETSEMNVRLRAADYMDSVRGSLVGSGGEQIPNARITLASLDGTTRIHRRTDVYGEFAFEDVVSDQQFQVLVAPLDGYRALVTPAISVADAGRLDLTLTPVTGLVEFRGRVISPAGDAVAGLALNIQAAASKAVAVRSGPDGTFAAQVPSGLVSVRSEGSPRVAMHNVNVSADLNREITVSVDWGTHSLVGAVVDSDGTPVSGSSVRLQWHAKDGKAIAFSERRSRTDSEGQFAFENVSNGPHALTVSRSGYRAKRETVVLNTDESVHHITLERQTTL